MIYEANMARNHSTSSKAYDTKHVQLIHGHTHMEKTNIKISFMTHIKKVHDNHTDEHIFMHGQPEQHQKHKKIQNQNRPTPTKNNIPLRTNK